MIKSAEKENTPNPEREDIIRAFVGEQVKNILNGIESRDSSSKLIRSTMRNLSQSCQPQEESTITFLLEQSGASPRTISLVLHDFDHIRGDELSEIIEDYNHNKSSPDSAAQRLITLHSLLTHQHSNNYLLSNQDELLEQTNQNINTTITRGNTLTTHFVESEKSLSKLEREEDYFISCNCICFPFYKRTS